MEKIARSFRENFTLLGNRILSSILVIRRSFRLWSILVKVILETTHKILVNPSFWIFCTLAIGIGSLGLWIEVFYGKGIFEAIESSDKNTLLTFSIALLGSVAVERYFEKFPDLNNGDLEIFTRMYLGVFFWCVSILLSFYSYFEKDYWYLGLSSSVVFWIVHAIHKPVFDRVNEASLENWRISIDNKKGDIGESGEDELGGKGL